MKHNNKIVIVGATSAIAEHCARLWISRPSTHMVLIGRNQHKTELVAADLMVRNPEAVIEIKVADFNQPAQIQQLADEICATTAPDIVLIAHGMLADQQECQKDLTICAESLQINAISPVLFAEAFAGHMQRFNQGCLAIIGSVAGDRGRKSNYIYGAAKALLERYAEGLQHRLFESQLSVSLVKPGPTATPMTAHLANNNLKLASTEQVAQAITRGIELKKPVIYAPSKWWLIMTVIKNLPRFIFNRMDI